jgi:cyclin H
MTYHPTDIVKTALFFATKTENHYFRLTKFAEAIGKTTPEDVLASEFLLTQGLRFTFDVRHPFRALEGAVMELQAIANSNGGILPFPGANQVLPPKELGNMNRRVRDAHGKAREYLKTSALLSDAYFHYTPSQIMFAALNIADPDLVKWYISSKFPSLKSDTSTASPQLDKVLSTIRACASMIITVPPTAQPSEIELKEMKQLAKKLQKCRNPDKIDLVALNKKAKREGEEEGVLDERALKKRKLEKERLAKEGEDLFGPALPRKGG